MCQEKTPPPGRLSAMLNANRQILMKLVRSGPGAALSAGGGNQLACRQGHEGDSSACMDDGRVNDLSQVVTAIVRINIDDTIMASDQGTELGCLRHALREAAGDTTTSSGLKEHVILNHQDVIITKICGKEQACTIFSSTTIRGESADIRTLMPGTSYDMARQMTLVLCVQRHLPLYAM